jgi:cytochrome c oxidase subunit 2
VSEKEPDAAEHEVGRKHEAVGGERIAEESHPLAKMLLIGLVASVIGTAIVLWIDWFPEDGGSAAGPIDTLYDVLLICSVPIFVLVMAIVIYSVMKFRARPGDTRDGAPIHGNTRLEVIWVTIPFIIVSALSVYGWIVLDDIEAKEKDPLVVRVTGQQFTWRFEYPQKIKSDELILPKDRPVEFRIKTEDVIHSFWVPEFRLKSDTVPGITTTVRTTPNKVGEWNVVCAELCGIGHATMRQEVKVLEASAFDSWMQKQMQAAQEGGGAGGGGSGGAQGGGGGAQSASAQGKQIFNDTGCGSCHALADAGSSGAVGPGLDKLSKATEAYVKESIVDPQADVVKGFPAKVMPDNYEEQLSSGEIDALTEYLLDVGGGKGK